MDLLRCKDVVENATFAYKDYFVKKEGMGIDEDIFLVLLVISFVNCLFLLLNIFWMSCIFKFLQGWSGGGGGPGRQSKPDLPRGKVGVRAEGNVLYLNKRKT